MEKDYYKILSGNKCYLSPILLDDVDHYVAWFNDLSVTINLSHTGEIYTLEKELKVLESFSKGYMFAILDKGTNKLIGIAGFTDISLIDRRAIYHIVIGDKNFWNKGYGLESTKQILDYGFNILNLHNIYLSVFSFNQRAICCFERAGFRSVGKLTGYKQVAGEKFDLNFMEISSDEYVSEYVTKILDEVKQDKGGMSLKLV